ncbi:MAG: NFYB/HAP3 family transcription factor subunit [Candidatus Subteraquimicrobiales bacterium]|nr:NFYB/HAP3 family transcription factor subunit [Candidatus Subteraquimicrobiales bacterium]
MPDGGKSNNKKGLVNPPFPKATFRRAVLNHRVQESTRISDDSLLMLNEVLDEFIGWIVQESEKIAISEGKMTINEEHIRDAVKMYFGERDTIDK